MRILIVEDDRALASGLSYHLKEAGYDVDVCSNGADGLALALAGAHELILLDRMLPEMDGLRVIAKMRSAGSRTPVLMMTALGGINDRVDGLDAGADDYLAKPFAMEEMLARVRALLRRPVQLSDVNRVQCGDIVLFENRGLLKGADGSCELSKRECALLAQFMRNASQTMPRDLLLSRVWGPGTQVEDGNLDNYVYFLRKRLKAVNSRAKISTVHGLGYRLEVT